jgi:hypothetical protein
MNNLTKTYPLFTKGSPSAQYQQISNFCVNYTEGLLISLMHLEIDEEFSESPDTYKKLQKKIQRRERTIRHAFQFQIEKLFSDFKTVRRTRLHANRASDWLTLGLTGQNASIVRASIEKSSEHLNAIYEKPLAIINERLKTLVHRTDSTHAENPVTPENLCNAFLTCIEALSFTSKQLSQLIGLYDRVLSLFLEDLYRQLDLGMYYLDILPELTDPEIFRENSATEKPPEIFTPDNEAEPAVDIKETPTVSTDEVKTATEQAPEELDQNKPAAEIDHYYPLVKTEENQELDDKLEEFLALTRQGSLDYALLYASFLHSSKGLFESRQRNEVFRFLNFFTHLLDNPRLSQSLKIQLSRLSQPLLRLVMVDPFFFRSSNHPVNEFLLSIIDYEIRYGGAHVTADLIAPLFDQLLASDNVTLDVFNHIIQQFEALKDSETNLILEQKRDDKQEQKKIRDEVLNLVNQITEKLIVEPEVLGFFYDDWQLLLLQIASKIGQKSTSFIQAVEIARMLAWSLDENHQDNPEYSKYSFASLLKAIDKGLISLNFSAEHRNRIRKLLVREFRKIQVAKAPPIVKPKKSLNSFNSFDQFNDTITQFSINMTDLTHVQPIEDTAFIEFLNSLQYGSWVEIREDRKSRFKRGKLKWKAQDNSRFIFIDQRGHKINESNIDQLKQYYADNMIKVLTKPKPFSSKRPTLGHGYTDF